MKTIPLTRGHVALVDDEDFEMLSEWTWCLTGSGAYVVRYAGNSRQPGRRVIRMHRQILGLTIGDGVEVDHINGDGLDNRRRNLRPCSHAENLANMKQHVCAESSQFKGVLWRTDRSKWSAKIAPNGRAIALGCFDSEMDAAGAYDRAALEHFGEFARLNFPQEVSR